MSDFVQRNYLHPPITEAVIEIRIEHEFKKEEQEKLARQLNRTYPNLSIEEAMDVKIDGNELNVQRVHSSFRLSSSDEEDLLVLRPSSFSLSRLAPYAGWPEFIERARRDWAIWLRHMPRRPVVRLGIRYINRIDIPAPGDRTVNPSDYLLIVPNVPDIVSRPISNYVVQIEAPTHMEHWSTRVVSRHVSPPPLVGYVSLLLDIDNSRTEAIPQRPDELWETVWEARSLKNQIFENCITDTARALFDK